MVKKGKLNSGSLGSVTALLQSSYVRQGKALCEILNQDLWHNLMFTTTWFERGNMK